MYIQVHVYNDGDTELTKVASPNKWCNDLFFDETCELPKLKAELIDYGFESELADEVIKTVLAAEEHEGIEL